MNFKIRLVAIKDMTIERRVQREFRAHHAKKMRMSFEENGISMGLPIVNLCGRGKKRKCSVIDGQHRLCVYKQLVPDWEKHKLLCQVYENLTLEEESQVYINASQQLKQSAYELYKNKLNAKSYPDIIEIEEVVVNLGLKIARGQNDSSIAAINAVLEVHKSGGAETLMRTLKVIRDGLIDRNYGASFIRGVGLLYGRYGSTIDDDRLTRQLYKLTGGSRDILADANGYLNSRCKVSQAIARALVDIYNVQLTKNRLPSWNDKAVAAAASLEASGATS